MSETKKPLARDHVPVLMQEVLAVLRPRAGKIFVDCTVGLGGHSAELVRRGAQVIGMDFDAGSLAVARERIAAVPKSKGRFQLVRNNFAALPTVLMEAGAGELLKVDGVLADLGVSSPQIDDAERGFSYRQPGPLDMRMDKTRGQSAAVLLARMSEEEISAALLQYGDETDAPQIAKLIIDRRAVKPIETTQELTAVVCQARRFTLQRAAGAKLHPAARTFQALRILVNREMANLERLLAVLPEVLKPGGVAAMITFHSGEDRRVKTGFIAGRRDETYSEISPEPIVATADEVRRNSRARSAKLRWAVKSH